MGVVRSLCRQGIATLARDIRPEADAEAASLGATVMRSPEHVAATASITILLVVDDGQIETVLFGNDGFVRASSANRIVVVSSTVDPHYVAGLAPRLSAAGIELVDAPVSGGPAKAAAGTMTIMASGPRAARERCAPVFAAIAGTVLDVGERPGDAATFKIVNNLLAAANLAAGAEALALAEAAGIDLRRVFEVVGASSGGSWIFADRVSRALDGDYAPRAATKILTKDVSIAAAFAERLGVDAPFARAAHAAFLDALAAGYGEDDDASILRRAAERAGTAIRGRR